MLRSRKRSRSKISAAKVSAATITSTARRLSQEASRRAGDLADVGRERWEGITQLPDDVRSHYEHHVEPRARRAGIGALEVAQALLAVGVAVPRLVARALKIARVLTEQAESAQQRGHDLAERARDLAHSVPPSARFARSRRWKAFGWITLGFVGGFIAGWVAGDARGLAARARDEEQALRHARVVALNDAGRDAGRDPGRDAVGDDPLGTGDRWETGVARERLGAHHSPLGDDATGAGPRAGGPLRATSSDGG